MERNEIYTDKTVIAPDTGNRRLALRILLLFLIVGWCVLIFCLSGETATESENRSGSFLLTLQNVLSAVFNEVFVRAFTDHVVRKSAHVFCYFVLSLLCMGVSFTVLFKTKKDVRFSYVATVLFCFIYAESDEIHQIFVPGRAGCMRDVGIDMIGVGAGMLFAVVLRGIFRFIRKKRENKRQNDKKKLPAER